MTAAKAFIAGATAFLGFVASKGVELAWPIEATIVAAIASVAVYVVPNLPRKDGV